MSLLSRLNPASLTQSLMAVVRRFPLPLLCATGLTVCMMVWLEYHQALDDAQEYQLFQAMLLLGLGATASLLAHLLCEFRQWGKNGIALGYLGSALLVGVYGWLMPEHREALRYGFFFSYGILMFALHLGIALTPRAAGRDDEALWRFNVRLFLRYAFSVINVVIIYVGVALAIVSVDKLFGLSIDEDIFGHLWFVCTFFLHPLLFLGGVPKKDGLAEPMVFPKSLRFTLRFIAVPLTCLYLIILYLYAGKILVQMSWPNGWVAMPVFILSVVGVLTYLLSLPLRETESWAKLFHRILFPLLLPLSVLLLLSLEERISEYGITENRYVAVALGVWLFGVSLLYTLKRKQTPSILMLPLSLLLFSLVAIWGGPISASGVSEASQMARLKVYAGELGALDEAGQLVPTQEEKFSEAHNELRSCIGYLIDWHGGESLEPLLGQFFAVEESREGFMGMNSYLQRRKVTEYIGISPYRNDGALRYDLYYDRALPTLGHQYFNRRNYNLYSGRGDESRKISIKTPRGVLEAHYVMPIQMLTLKHEEKTVAEIDLTGLYERVFNEQGQSFAGDTIVSLPFEGAGWSGHIIISDVTMEPDDHRIKSLKFFITYTPPSK